MNFGKKHSADSTLLKHSKLLSLPGFTLQEESVGSNPEAQGFTGHGAG